MYIIVTGSDGYVGAPLCRRLRAAGHQVQGFDRRIYGQPIHKTTITAGAAGLEVYLRESSGPPPDVIVHLAAYAHDPKNLIPALVMFQNNAVEARRVLDAARSVGVRFIATSSLSVFSPGAYPASKRLMERLLLDGAPGLDVDIVRFGTLFGVDVGDQNDAFTFRPQLLLNKMVADAFSGRIYVQAPSIQRPVCSLRFALATLMHLIVDNIPHGTVSNAVLTCGTLGEFANFVADVFPTERPIIQIGAPEDARDYGWGRFDSKYIKRELLRLMHWFKEFGADVTGGQLEKMYRFIQKEG